MSSQQDQEYRPARNGHRPASTGVYSALWESKVHELMELLTRTSLETHKLDLMAEISSLKIKLASAEKDRRDLDDRLRMAQRQISELESKLAVRDAEISELRQRLVRNGTVLTPDANALEELFINIEDDTSSTSSTTPSVSDGTPKDQNDDRLMAPNATSTPVVTVYNVYIFDNYYYYYLITVNLFGESIMNTGTGTVISGSHRQSGGSSGIQRSNSAEDLNKKRTTTTTNNNQKESYNSNGNSTYGTFPKDRIENEEHVELYLLSYYHYTLSAHTEVVTDDEDGLQHIGMAAGSPLEVKKKKGLKKFFGKLKRSGSQDFHERERSEQFRRGGVRATASGRLGWSRDMRVNDDTPFSRWDSDRVTAWLNDIGLNMYLVECKRWVRNGEQLLRASPHDLEKELGIKHCLHRKKLLLALQAVNSNTYNDKLAELDFNWVTRWLDDIGLPQYKDHFYDARVDGRMLQYLTVDDLLSLKVSNELHHISIKRGIQVLMVNGFNPQCLRRRPSPEEGPLQNIPGEVALWTNHRVMEWLRTIDLSEYAPNLRGSGVHGSLMSRSKFGIFGHKRSKSETEFEGYICPVEVNGTAGRGRFGNSPRDKEKDEKAAKEIGAFSKEINTLTDMLSSERFLETVPTSNV
ncbi:hypothetical protein KUTeg_023064 [Tegillarca granosa]|uniref:SAM domain-containing protein n=1 Tax=Tegillarca granosa TaxID=220873 RepID=A0ABQ9E0Z3_TEGGR|nr:hypothetical protein KUTeg_023064 [Tegillarca granosa]